jgi:glucokinase
MIIGIDLGGTNVRAAIENDGLILNFRKESFNQRCRWMNTLTQLKGIYKALVKNEVRGIGIGSSVVDVKNGVVIYVTNIPAGKVYPQGNIGG